jgi:predicted Fe-Mo cluster-binding NifX family protein
LLTVKVAIPMFGERVSPRFDCAASFLLVEIEHGEVLNRRELDASGWGADERTKRLVALGVKVLLCGGIDRGSTASLRSEGIMVYSRLAGPIERSLNCFLQDGLPRDTTPTQTDPDLEGVPR